MEDVFRQSLMLYAVGTLTSLSMSAALAAVYWRTNHGVWWVLAAFAPVTFPLGAPLLTAFAVSSYQDPARMVLIQSLPSILYGGCTALMLILLAARRWPNKTDGERN